MVISKNSEASQHDAKISLVITTLGRKIELARCLQSITQQTLPPFQVIIVDQNPVGWLDDTITPFIGHLPIEVVRSPRGAALGRNCGAARAGGEIIGFPDDDCWYNPALLSQIENWLSLHPAVALLTTRIVDQNNESVILRWPSKTTALDISNIWQTCLLAAFFVRVEPFRCVDGFDPDLGVGSPSGMESSEETDLALRLFSAGYKGMFEPSIHVFHAADAPKNLPGQEFRALRYGRGIGWALAKHKHPWAIWFRFFIRPIGGMLFALLRRDLYTARYHWFALKGRWEGWRSFHRANVLNRSRE